MKESISALFRAGAKQRINVTSTQERPDIMTIRTSASAANRRSHWKHLTLALPGILALALAATLLAGCDDKQDAAGEDGTSGQIETKAEAVKGAEELEAGYAAMDAGDYKTAVEHFTKSADEGNSDALLMLYVCYCEGFGVKKQEEGMAEKYLKPAADAGNEIAMTFYGFHIILEENDPERGIEYLTKLADGGCAYTQHMLVKNLPAKKYGIDKALAGTGKLGKYLENLAALPLTGKKTVLDHIPGYIDSKKLFVEKTEINLKEPTVMNKIIVFSQATLGVLCADGADGIPRDRKKAKEWLNKAKENGFGGTDAILKHLRLE